MATSVERDPSGNYIVKIKLAIKPHVYQKLLNIVEVSEYNSLTKLVSNLLSKELGVYNGVNVWIERTIEKIDNYYEGRD
jgi:hypothetical protein